MKFPFPVNIMIAHAGPKSVGELTVNSYLPFLERLSFDSLIGVEPINDIFFRVVRTSLSVVGLFMLS
jgi:hypothetical protein